MAFTFITVTCPGYTNSDGSVATGTVTFTQNDVRDINDTKISLKNTKTVSVSGGVFPNTQLLTCPGGYTVKETFGSSEVSYVIRGDISVNLSSVDASTAQFDTSAVGVVTVEDIPAGATYTTVLADLNKLKRSVSATGQAFRIDGSLAWPVGASIDGLQWAAGRLTVSGINGAVVRNPDSAFITRKQYCSFSVTKITSTDFLVQGDVSVS